MAQFCFCFGVADPTSIENLHLLLVTRENELFVELKGKVAGAGKEVFDMWMLRESDLVQVKF